MKNSVKKVLLGVSTIAMLSSGLIGCRKNNDNPNQIDIYVVNAGYRYEWVNAIKDLFLKEDWVKEKYPNLTVSIYQNDNQTYAETIMDAGRSSNKFDLMFSMNLAKFSGHEDALDLTDVVYNKEIPGTTTLYKDFLNSSFLKSYEYYPKGDTSGEPRYYFAPWAGGMNGIVYNATFFEQRNYKVPNTTDELVAICKDFRDATYKADDKLNSQYCFIQGKEEGYFNNLFDVFWTQYQGIDGYIDFWNGIDDGTLSKAIFTQQGRLKSLNVYKQLLMESEHFVSPSSDSQTFMASQRNFLKGAALFNCNGDWFVSEMKEIKEDIINHGGANYTFKMMKTPIVSSIIGRCDTIENDAELSALVTAIDNGDSSLTGEGYEVSQEDYDKIREARRVIHSYGATHQAIIPSYALAKDAAVDFVRFMATDKAQDAYIKATDGASLPFNYNLKEKNPTLFNEIDPLHQDRINYVTSSFTNAYTLPSKYNFPLNKYGHVDAFYLSNGYDFFTKIRKDGKEPQQYYDDTIAYYTDTVWNDTLRNAGLR